MFSCVKKADKSSASRPLWCFFRDARRLGKGLDVAEAQGRAEPLGLLGGHAALHAVGPGRVADGDQRLPLHRRHGHRARRSPTVGARTREPQPAQTPFSCALLGARSRDSSCQTSRDSCPPPPRVPGSRAGFRARPSSRSPVLSSSTRSQTSRFFFFFVVIVSMSELSSSNADASSSAC